MIDLFFPRIIKGNYYEPFLGGGAILLGFLHQVDKGIIVCQGDIVASDVNADLIHCWHMVQKQPKHLVKCLSEWSRIYTHLLDDQARETFYYEKRAAYNAIKSRPQKSILHAVYFMFLNRTSYRGLYRENMRTGAFNVPFGHDTAFTHRPLFDEKNIYHVSRLIQNVHFSVSSFQEILNNKMLSPKDFYYFDPPYYPLKCDSFVRYTRQGFSHETHVYFFYLLKTMSRLGALFIVHNSDCPFIRDQCSFMQWIKIKNKQNILYRGQDVTELIGLSRAMIKKK